MSKIKKTSVLLLAFSLSIATAIPFEFVSAQTSTTTATSTTDTSTTTVITTSTPSGTIVTTDASNPVLTATTVSTVSVATITSSLSVGSSGSQVTALQNFLAQDPSVYPEGLITGYFGSLTERAVRRFQQKYGIAVVGRVGPITRNKINSLMGGTTGTTFGTSPRIYNVSTSTQSNQDGTRSFTLSWQTDRGTRAKVFYSSNPLTFTENQSSNSEPFVSGSVISDTTFGTSKTLSISNLSSGTTYNYMIEAIDGNGNVSITWPASLMTQ